MKELVNHPNHYNKEGRRECWDEMIDLFGADFVVIFDTLSAYKYYYRAGEKEGNPTEQDLAKIDTYMKHSQALIDSGKSNNILVAFCNTKMKEILNERH